MGDKELGEQTPMAPDQTKRKLAAILAADIAGYSRLMGADEEGTLARLYRCFAASWIDPKNKQHRRPHRGKRPVMEF